MHTISSHRGNRPTNTPTDRTDYNTLRRSLARSVNMHASGPQIEQIKGVCTLRVLFFLFNVHFSIVMYMWPG